MFSKTKALSSSGHLKLSLHNSCSFYCSTNRFNCFLKLKKLNIYCSVMKITYKMRIATDISTVENFFNSCVFSRVRFLSKFTEELQILNNLFRFVSRNFTASLKPNAYNSKPFKWNRAIFFRWLLIAFLGTPFQKLYLHTVFCIVFQRVFRWKIQHFVRWIYDKVWNKKLVYFLFKGRFTRVFFFSQRC